MPKYVPVEVFREGYVLRVSFEDSIAHKHGFREPGSIRKSKSRVQCILARVEPRELTVDVQEWALSLFSPRFFKTITHSPKGF